MGRARKTKRHDPIIRKVHYEDYNKQDFYAYLLTYRNKVTGLEVKELYGQYDKSSFYFSILASQFRNKKIKSWIEVYTYAYPWLSDAKSYESKIQTLIFDVEAEGVYECSYEIVPVTLSNWKDYRWEELEEFKEEVDEDENE